METAVAQAGSPKKQNKSLNGGLDDSVLDNVLADLPKPVLNRVNALKNLQLKIVDIETKFYEELHHLECKYAEFFQPIHDQREKIISGEYEPTEEESKWVQADEQDSDSKPQPVAELASDLKEKANLNEQIKGIPDFWLQAFKSTDLIGEMIQEHDEPVLKYLRDIKVKMHDQKPYGYTLEFYFNDNEYFKNKVLTKTYELTVEVDRDDPFGYDGPYMYKCSTSKIDWNPGKDVTMKIVKKKQKHKSSGTIRVITKEEKQDSFFNYFDTPTQDGVRPIFRHLVNKSELKEEEKELDEEDDEEIESLYEADFEIGHFFKEFLVPKAVLYFTGELVDEANYDDEEEYDDEDEDEEDDENENDDDEEQDDEKSPSKNVKNLKSKRK
jgi:hypothetical protein